eukprot:5938174-Alexandrium_andersonii.AAC.1
MSASLVGSEMCIRDRPQWPEKAMRKNQEIVACTTSDLIQDAMRESYPRPVSYTHLTLPTICSV